MARNSLAYLPSEAWQSTWPTTWQQLHPTLFTRRPSYQSKLNQLSRLSSVPARSMPLSWDYVRDRVDLWVLTKVEKKKNRNSWPEATINCSKLDTIAKKIAGILNKGIVKCQELGDNNSSLCINFKRNERSPGSSLTLILTRSKNSFSLLFSFLKKKKKKDGVIIRATRVFGPDFLEIQIFRAVLVERWLRTVRKYILAHGRRHGCRYDNR